MDIGLGLTVNIDWLYQVRNNRGFTGGDVSGASVGNFSHVQLLNPVASGKTIIVRFVTAFVGTTARVHVRTHNTALLTNSGNVVNLSVGAAAAVGQIRLDQPAALQGTLARVLQLETAKPFVLFSDWSFQLDAGEGIVVVPATTNIECQADFDWVEF